MVDRLHPQISQISADEKDPQTYAIIGAAMEVHRQLGHGFLEGVYHEALEVELEERGIPFEHEARFTVTYKQRPLSCLYKADLVCFGSVLVEVKALDRLTNVERAQVINYLKVTGLSRALLINFGAPSLQYERLVFNHLRQSAKSADK